MIKFTNLIVEGFCSIQNFEWNLNQDNITIIRGKNGSGKAQPITEPVLTTERWKKMGDLVMSDLIINPDDGKPMKLLGIYDRGKLDSYKVTFSDGTSTECCGDHLWEVEYRNSGLVVSSVIDTNTLLKNYKHENKRVPGTYKYRYSIPLTEPINLQEKDLPIHPYILGFIIGDGCISGDKACVRVSTNIIDSEEVIERLRSYGADIPVGIDYPEKGVTHFRIHGLKKQLKELGLLGCKSGDKFIPEEYLNSSIEQRKLLLAGLLDTDGSVSGSKRKTSKTYSYSSKSEKLVNGVVQLCRGLGGISQVPKCSDRYKDGKGTSYDCTLRLKFNPFQRGLRKNLLSNFTNRNRLVKTIRDIIPIGTRESRCIKVDSERGLYITRDYIVTHNTTSLSTIPWVLYGKTPKGKSDVNTWKECREKNYKGTMVQIFFEKNGVTYSVIRCQNYSGDVMGAKGKDRLILLKDGVEIEEKKKIQIQEAITKVLGMSYDLFKNSLMFGQGTKKLIQESGSDKKKLFEEIFELGYLNIAKELASRQLSELRSEIKEFENSITELGHGIKDTMATYEELMDSEKNFNKVIRGKRNEVKEKRKAFQEKIDSLKFDEVLLTKSLKELDSLQKTLDLLKKDYGNNIKSLKYEELEKMVKEIIDLMDGGKRSKVYSKLVLLLSVLDQVNQYTNRKETLEEKYNELVDIINTQENIKSKCEIYEVQITTCDKDLKKLKEEKGKVLSPKYKKKVEDLEKQLVDVEKEYNKRLKKYEDHTWLLSDPLGNKGIKSYIMESSLDFLNKTLDKYTDTLGFRVEFGIDLDTTKKDFYTLIEMNGHYAEYEEMSGGQQQLINLAMAFAMHESTSMSKGINLLILDEAFESLSRDNIELVIELIKVLSKDKSIYLISHLDSLPLGNSRVLNVDSRDGLTEFR